MTYDSIKVLEGIQHIRLRPGMYIGSTSNPNHLAAEILDNCLDEAMAGYCTKISIDVLENGLRVTDIGRGIPLRKDKEEAPIVTICSKLFSGGKFDKENYKISSGLHGVGITAVNATSSKLFIETRRDGIFNRAEFYTGSLVNYTEGNTSLPNGVTIECYPDSEIFESCSFDTEYLKERAKIASTFIPTLSIELNNKELKRTLPEELISTDTPVWFVENSMDNGERVQVWFGYSENKTDEQYDNGSVNLLPVNYGTHIALSIDMLKEAWSPFINDTIIEPNDVLKGLRMYTFSMLADPKYASQTKDRLSNKKADFKSLYDPIIVKMRKELSKNPKITEKLIKKFTDYRKHLNTLQSNRYLADVLELGESGDAVTRRGVSMSSKLVDCRSLDKESTELFIVEGDSAGGSLITRRNPDIHAVLPLRGKVLNVIGEDIRRVMGNLEIRSLINAIGVGLKHIEDVERCKYGKIILACDADVDGRNISALLLGALCHLTPGLVKAGRVYVCKAPLYAQYYDRKGFVPVYDEKDINPKYSFQRFKGLGEMNPDEAAKVFFDDKYRQLVQITLKDLEGVINLVGNSSYKKAVLVEAGVIR